MKHILDEYLKEFISPNIYFLIELFSWKETWWALIVFVVWIIIGLLT